MAPKRKQAPRPGKATGRRVGPRSVWTEELEEELLVFCALPVSLKEACAGARVSLSALMERLAKARRAREIRIETGSHPDSEPDGEFLEAFNQARGSFEADAVRDIAHDKDWHAKAWLLSRSNPKKWAQRVYQLVNDEMKEAIARLEAEYVDDPEGLERALSALTGGGGAEASESEEGAAPAGDAAGESEP